MPRTQAHRAPPWPSGVVLYLPQLQSPVWSVQAGLGLRGPQGPCPMNAEVSTLPPLLALQVKALGCDGNSPPSVPSWLDSLGLQDYVHSFLSSGYSSIDTVKNLWELELVNVSAASAQAWPGCS